MDIAISPGAPDTVRIIGIFNVGVLALDGVTMILLMYVPTARRDLLRFQVRVSAPPPTCSVVFERLGDTHVTSDETVTLTIVELMARTWVCGNGVVSLCP